MRTIPYGSCLISWMIVGFWVTTGTVAAEDYGRVTLVATYNVERVSEFGVTLARDIGRALRQTRKVLVEGEVVARPAWRVDRPFLSERRNVLGQVIVIGVNMGEAHDESMTIDVSLPFSEFEQANHFIGHVPVNLAGTVISRDTLKEVVGAVRAWILQKLSRGREVAVTLELVSAPPEAAYFVGASGPYFTDKGGYGWWQGNRGEGKETLRVVKDRFKDCVKELQIRRVSNQNMLYLSILAKLQKK